VRVKQGQEIGNRIARARDNGMGQAHAAGMQWIGVKEFLFPVPCSLFLLPVLLTDIPRQRLVI